jgi:transposase
MARHIGVDLHRNRFTACTLAGNGRTYLRTWELGELARFAKGLRPDDQVAVEVTGNTRLFYEAIVERVRRVVVVNPTQFRLISRSVNKTDANDARLLARFLAQGLLPEVRMKSKTHAQVASLTQTRDALVKLRTKLKNKVNNLLSARGINLRRESLTGAKGLQAVLSYPLEPIARVELGVIVEQIASLNASIAKLEETIRQEGRKLPGHTNLTSIKGIGDLGASILLSVIGDVEDFPSAEKLAAYFGIVPRVSNSNETERSGRITKRGNKLARTTLVQCALIAKRYSRYLSEHYERIKARRGVGKAIIAVARKLLGIVYRTLKGNWVFKDFGRFVLAEPAAARM